MPWVYRRRLNVRRILGSEHLGQRIAGRGRGGGRRADARQLRGQLDLRTIGHHLAPIDLGFMGVAHALFKLGRGGQQLGIVRKCFQSVRQPLPAGFLLMAAEAAAIAPA